MPFLDQSFRFGAPRFQVRHFRGINLNLDRDSLGNRSLFVGAGKRGRQQKHPGEQRQEALNLPVLHGVTLHTTAHTFRVAAWGRSASAMTHGSISGPGHGPRWESKWGPGLRIQHGLNELAGGSYGRVVAFYRKSRTLNAAFALVLEDVMTEKTSKAYLTAHQKKILRDQGSAVPTELRTAFAAGFAAWKNAWFDGGLAFDSNPQTRGVGKEYDALIALGPKILPLVIEALADPDNFLALQLYDAIQPDEKLVVHFDAEDERILEGEQGRAHRVVQAWFVNR